ncbi:8ede12a8-f000-45a4-9b3a-d7302396fd63 [Sclerotinia trifoliorum]|uniref:8ede12a8-f000-45a4-9b3a-d7302396fd63 n=1 Tax=Sclerotinia trifoliorum TaxID=28548 RepID=A0A8H2ZWM2_9HELO|nr:8ede12a8-f000-45a4-9b3a-d7302396fd63 [Sclerotinia trifoliorum]
MANVDAAGPILWSAEGETVDGETVNVYIGKCQSRFEINKAFLLDKVPFFRTMFKRFGPRVIGRKAIYPNGDPESFGILLNWLHTHRLPALAAKFEKGDGEVEYFGYQPDKLYYLVAKFQLFNLANHIMDCLKPCHHYLYVGFSKEQIMSIYSQDINEGVPFYGLRKFVSMWLLHEWNNPRFEHNSTTKAEYESLLEIPEILEDLSRLDSGLERRCPWHLLTCSLHKHDENNRCAQRMYTFETVESSHGEISVHTRLR